MEHVLPLDLIQDASLLFNWDIVNEGILVKLTLVFFDFLEMVVIDPLHGTCYALLAQNRLLLHFDDDRLGPLLDLDRFLIAIVSENTIAILPLA